VREEERRVGASGGSVTSTTIRGSSTVTTGASGGSAISVNGQSMTTATASASASDSARRARDAERRALDAERRMVEQDRRAARRAYDRQIADSCGKADEDSDERIAALNALLQMDAERAMPLLKKVLARRDLCSAPLRRKAVFLVSQKRAADNADVLLAAAKDDPDYEVREQAVFWLGQIPGDRSLDILEQIARSTGDDALKEKAAFALSQHKSERAGRIMRDLATQKQLSSNVREQVIFWLGQRRSPENSEFLRSLYGSLETAVLREKAIFALAQNKQPENAKFLTDIALNTREPLEVRKQALFWAGQQGIVNAADLGALYKRTTDREMKQQVIFVLSQRKSTPEAVDQLITIARSEPDREVRKNAVFWLSQSKDPRVLKFLEEILDR